MSGNGLAACDDIVPRLGQHPRDPTTAAESDLKAHFPERLHDVVSQCQTQDEVDRELRDDYEMHRRSAHLNLSQYLDALQQAHAEERSKYIHEVYSAQKEDPSTDMAMEMRDLKSSASGLSREQWRVKVLRDALSRDLLAMQETLDLLAARTPREAKRWSSRWHLFVPRFWFCVGLLNPFLWAMCLYRGVYGLLVTGDAAFSLGRWKWPRTRRIESYRERVNHLYRLLHRGQLEERNRGDLTQCCFDW